LAADAWDEINNCSGIIIPSGRTKVIQPFETGVVRAIHVRDGRAVTTGEVLVELDPTVNDAEHLESDLTTAELDIARLSAALSPAADPLAALKPVETASPMMVAMQREYLSQPISRQWASTEARHGEALSRLAGCRTPQAPRSG
jgi:hemolysin D